MATATKKVTTIRVLGGPGTLLPRFVESFLSWILALSLLSVSGYHYIRTVLLRSSSSLLLIELTTSSRSEQTRMAQDERCQQLITYLQKTVTNTPNNDNVIESDDDDEAFVQAIRQSEIARRLASLVMVTGEEEKKTATKRKTLMITTATLSAEQQQKVQLLKQKLRRLWPLLLRLPPPDNKYQEHEQSCYQSTGSSSSTSSRCDISVIMPAYYENGYDIKKKLQKALDRCRNPQDIEIILIDAGKCTELNENIIIDSDENNDKKVKENKKNWGAIHIVPFIFGGGRGPCLNYGASKSNGRILSFVHSDTILPPDWDMKIINAFDGTNNKCYRANSCAFSFGINTMTTTNSKNNKKVGDSIIPPGIKAIETTANWRTHLYSLPYGDQVLSVPSVIFNYVGGFPDQCLMEDYELIALLRRRCSNNTAITTTATNEKETLAIIGGIPAMCSPRRWQKHGVLYVTLTNSRLVNLYAGRTFTPDDLYENYYGAPPPKRTFTSNNDNSNNDDDQNEVQKNNHNDHELALWELELQQIIK